MDRLIRDLQQIALIQKKLDSITTSSIPKSEQGRHIIDQIEMTNNFAMSAIDNIISNKISLTENSLNLINHELRTPLVPIRVYSDMLYKGKFGPLTDEQKKRVARINENAKRMQKKIELLLDKNLLQASTKPDSDTEHRIKELEQEKIILEKINHLLIEKNHNDDLEIKTLRNNLIASEHQKNELEQAKSIMNKTIQLEEQKNSRLTKKNAMIIAAAAMVVGVGFSAYSLYVADLIGKQYVVSNLGNMPTGYVIQNLKGDTIDTWLSWRLVSGSVLHVGITNGAKYHEKIPLIKEVILSENSIDVDDSLLHKGPKGSTSTYYVGWKGALKNTATKSTLFYIPVNLEVNESSNGEGEITIVLTSDKSGDGYSGYTKSIADDSQNQILKSTITIYDVDNLTDEQFKTVLRHEFGHALGLAHSTAPEDLMAPTIQTSYPYISECDMSTISNLYDGVKNSQVTCKK